MLFKYLILSFIICFIPVLNAQESPEEIPAETSRSTELTYSLGMALITLTEGATTLSGQTNITEPFSGSASVIVGNLNYKFKPSRSLSYSIGVNAPLLPGDGSSYFDGYFTLEYYFNQHKSRQQLETNKFTINIKPKLRYYLGGEIGIGYLVYLTKTARKNDALFNFGGTGGLIYDISKKWGVRLSASVLKSTGVIISGIVIKATLGGTYYLDL